MEKNGVLTETERKKTKKNSIIDGSAYSVMYGFGEQYVIPFAIKLGATNSQVGILASVPSFIGSVFQIVGAKLADKWKNRKKIVTLFVFLQSLTLLPLFILPFLTKNILLLTIIFTLYMLFGNIVGPAWSSWIGDVVLEKERAKYFSIRNKYVVASMMVSVLIAGLILEYFTDTNIWTGFAILFSISFIGRVVSAIYLSKQFEPQYKIHDNGYFSFRDFLRRMPETNFGNFVMYRSLMAFSVMIAAPFFSVFMLKNLHFTYMQYTAVVLVPMLIKVLTMRYWGKYSDKFGTKNIMFVSGILIAFIPFWWFLFGMLLEHNTAIFYIIILAECIGGFAWAGFELATFNYVLETVPAPKRTKAFAYFNMVFGTLVLLGGLLGSMLVFIIPPILGFSSLIAVFFISFVVRGTVATIFSHRLREVRIEKKFDETKLFFDLVIAKPLHGALHQTSAMIMFAEKEINMLAGTTKYAAESATAPVMPKMAQLVRFIDDTLEKIEPIRKNVEPQNIKAFKKRTKKELLNTKISKEMKKYYNKNR